MTTFVRFITITSLLFISISALLGGSQLIADPTGQTLFMSLDWLDLSPFDDYLIPGILLFLFIGVSGLFICVMVMVGNRHYPTMVLLQGLILTTWMVGQVIILTKHGYMQLVYFLLGLLLIVTGNILSGKRSKFYDKEHIS